MEKTYVEVRSASQEYGGLSAVYEMRMSKGVKVLGQCVAEEGDGGLSGASQALGLEGMALVEVRDHARNENDAHEQYMRVQGHSDGCHLCGWHMEVRLRTGLWLRQMGWM